MTPIRTAIIGMGGFAAAHHDTVARLEASGELRLIATCDPALGSFAERQTQLGFPRRGVRLFDDYRAMLDACRGELDLVTIPTPIPLHAPMHRAAVERGLAVYLEKPPTLDYAELEQMIAVDAAAAKQTVVGFNFIVEAARQALKRRLVAGEFGRVREVVAQATWPRAPSYFQRAAWAGKLQLNGRLVLDSCIGNAMAHQVHNALFWAGTGDFWSWGELAAVHAELYRAHAIEGLDTACISATTAGGVTVRIGMTHACTGAHAQEERVVCERATLRYHIYNSGPGGVPWTLTWHDGRTETGTPVQEELVDVNFRAYAAYLRGSAPRPVTRLADSRPFVHLNNLAYLAAGRITTIPATAAPPRPDGTLDVAGLVPALTTFCATGQFPSAQGLPWSAPGGHATPADLHALPRLIAQLAATRAAELGG